MIRYSAIVFAVLCTAANADCYLRLTSNITNRAIFGEPTDVQRLVTPDPKGHKCVLRYRLNVDLEWRSIEGVGYGKTDDLACSSAKDVRSGRLLEEVTREKVRAGQEMVCSDLPDIRVRPVRIGETVWESEVDVHTIPAERPYFNYKNTVCRTFVERNVKNRNLWTYQGVICKQDSLADSKWRVVDKY